MVTAIDLSTSMETPSFLRALTVLSFQNYNPNTAKHT